MSKQEYIENYRQWLIEKAQESGVQMLPAFRLRDLIAGWIIAVN